MKPQPKSIANAMGGPMAPIAARRSVAKPRIHVNGRHVVIEVLEDGLVDHFYQSSASELHAALGWYRERRARSKKSASRR